MQRSAQAPEKTPEQTPKQALKPTPAKTAHLLRMAVILGLVSAVGPFAIDMYLPALPSIGQSLNASPSTVQLSLMVFFIALGLGQLVYGPASDMLGRRAPLFFGLALFTFGSVGCALAPDVHTLIVFRFIQGLGGCAGMVVPRAVVRDLHTGADAARLMSMLMLVFSISPILAPLTGGIVIQWWNWRGVFWLVMGAALLAIVLIATMLKETRPREARVESNLRGALAAYRLLLTDGPFIGLALIGAFGMASFFTYLANSSFVIIDHYGFSPRAYGLFFGVNAAAFFGAAQMNGWLSARYGLRRVVRGAVLGFCVSTLVLVAVFAAGVDRVDVMATLLFVSFGFLGLVIPTTSVLALDHHGPIAGTASAMMGTLQFGTGVVVMGTVGVFVDGTPMPMLVGIAACSTIAVVLTRLTLRRSGDAAHDAHEAAQAADALAHSRKLQASRVLQTSSSSSMAAPPPEGTRT